MNKWQALVAGGFMASQVLANDGVLPRGRGQSNVVPSPSPNPAETPVAENKAITGTECFSYTINPSLGDLYISPNQKYIYFLSRSAGEVNQVGSKTYVYEVDLVARTSRRIVGLKLDQSPVLIGHGNPVEGASVFDLKKGRPECGEGVSAGVGVQWLKQQKIVKNFPSSRYKIVASDSGNYLADLDQGIVQGFDFTSLQKRTLVSFPKELLPLFVEFQPPKIFAYHEQKSEIQVYLSGKKEPETSLVLKKGAKLIQDGKLLGIVEQGSQPHQVMVRTIKGWSGDSFRSHALDLPKDWSFDNLRIDYDFGAEIALVSAADFKMRRGSVAPQFRKVLLFNKAKNTPIAELSLADDLYFGSVDLSADGKFIFSLVRSLEDDGAKVFKTWSVDDGKWLEDIALTRETVPEQTTKTKPKG